MCVYKYTMCDKYLSYFVPAEISHILLKLTIKARAWPNIIGLVCNLHKLTEKQHFFVFVPGIKFL